MSWDQDYSFPSLFELFRNIVQFNVKDKDIINYSLKSLHLPYIVEIERIPVDTDYYQDIFGSRITLSDGSIYETVRNKKKSYTQNGNYGCDIYEWKKIK